MKRGKSKSFGASSRIKKRNDNRRYMHLALRIFIFVILIITPVLFLRSSFMQVREIKVLPAETALHEPIKAVVKDFISGDLLSIFPKSNLFILDGDDLSAVLLSEFPDLESVDINRRFDKSLEISIKERSSDYLWCDKSAECFNMTKSGLVFSEYVESVDFSENKLEKIVFRGEIVGNPIGQQFASPDKMQKYENLILYLQNSFDVLSVSIESDNKIVIETEVGNIFFNGEESDLRVAVDSAVLLIKDIRSKDSSAVFLYVDARFGKKVFYKLN